MLLKYIQTLSEHCQWANSRLFSVVETLSEGEYQSNQGIFFGSIEKTLDHILLSDRIWMARILEKDNALSQDTFISNDFKNLRIKRFAEDKKICAETKNFTEEDLNKIIVFTSLSNGSYRIQRGILLTNMFNHGTHHRGQVHAILTKLQRKVPPLDIFPFLIKIDD